MTRTSHTWNLPRTPLQLGPRTILMGILNITPDSFSDGGKYFDQESAIARGKEIEQEGADIIDIGGESSRPGSEPISEEEESRRVLPVIEGLAGAVKIPLSIDTYRSGVAKRAIDTGAQIINDISAFRFDERMAEIAAKQQTGVVLMHSRGSRETLHKQTRMNDVIHEVNESLKTSAENARAAGVSSGAIVIDPGIGFGKAADESITVLGRLTAFSKLGYPLLVGTSRKSFIRLITEDPEARHWGTAATVVWAIANGAHIVRVHDVRQSRTLANMTDRLMS
jgi:dihydropteroate synthase